MSDNTGLADRMARYEQATRTVLPRRTYTVVRVGGRAFRAYLRSAQRPYDDDFMAAMDNVGVELCREICGSVFAFVHSDEISVLLTDFDDADGEPWCGGDVQQMTSVAAAIAAAHLNQARDIGTGLAVFAARAFTIDDPGDVADCFICRQREAVRNSIIMAAQAHFSRRQLDGVSIGDMPEMLWREKQVSWEDYPDGARRGRVVVRRTAQRTVTYPRQSTGELETVTATRSWWEAEPAPNFTHASDDFLDRMIPTMRNLAAA